MNTKIQTIYLNREQLGKSEEKNTRYSAIDNTTQFSMAVKVLIDLGRITIRTEQTDGRPRQVLKALQYEKNEINELKGKNLT